MGLRALAAADLVNIVQDEDLGGELCTITSPADVEAVVSGITSDIHLGIDPGTGEVVTGRQAEISVLESDLVAAGFEGIRGVADATARPWRVSFAGASGGVETYKVVAVHPDNTIGLFVLVLGRFG